MRYLIIFFSLSLGIFLSCNSSNSRAHQGDHQYTNSLVNESSPYLLQHAHNPVNWFPWKEEALEKAKKEDKLILISIGYAACHWCHVMEHESFEDTAVARVMNENFINIKVDREERPDVDDVYMTACQLASQGGCGWPLNAIALPDGRPVWAGTYFPKKKWIEVLEYFIKAGKDDRTELEGYAKRLKEGIESMGQISFNENEANFTAESLNNLNEAVLKNVDFAKGGKVGAPKFPLPNLWQFLMRYHHFSGNEKSLEAVTSTLDNMANGGIYDHLGGGFARYSTDAQWFAPHFEKMMYDNGQLVSLYSQAFQLTKNPLYQQKVEETLIWIEREMTSKEGGFYSSLDADSEGEEGKFYVWKSHEIDSLLGSDQQALALFNDYYEVKKRGNWEHEKNILHRNKAIEKIAEKYADLGLEGIQNSITKSNQILFEARAKRVRPGLDDKVLTSWNALMLKGYVDAYKTFGKKEYLAAALKNGNFIIAKMMQSDGRLNRNYKDGKSVINAFLDDYALTIQAFMALYEVTFDESWLMKSKELAEHVFTHFSDDKSGMFFYTSDLDDALITRKMEIADNVIPASNSSMARALLYLGTYLYEEKYTDRATQMLNNVLPQFIDSEQPNFYSNWLQLYLEMVKRPYEIAIVGNDFAAKRDEMMKNYLPNAILLGGKDEGSLELLKDKLQEGETMIYVCQNKVCKFPVTEVEKALGLMK